MDRIIEQNKLLQNWGKKNSISVLFFPDKKIAGRVTDYTGALQQFGCMLDALCLFHELLLKYQLDILIFLNFFFNVTKFPGKSPHSKVFDLTKVYWNFYKCFNSTH